MAGLKRKNKQFSRQKCAADIRQSKCHLKKQQHANELCTNANRGPGSRARLLGTEQWPRCVPALPEPPQSGVKLGYPEKDFLWSFGKINK